jgi:hypothetical protein
LAEVACVENMRNITFWSETMKGRDQFEDTCIGERLYHKEIRGKGVCFCGFV